MKYKYPVNLRGIFILRLAGIEPATYRLYLKDFNTLHPIHNTAIMRLYSVFTCLPYCTIDNFCVKNVLIFIRQTMLIEFQFHAAFRPAEHACISSLLY